MFLEFLRGVISRLSVRQSVCDDAPHHTHTIANAITGTIRLEIFIVINIILNCILILLLLNIMVTTLNFHFIFLTCLVRDCGFYISVFFAFFSLHATTFTVAADRDHFLYNKFLFIFYTTQRYRVLCVDASVCNILIFGLPDRFQSRTKYLKFGEKWVYYFTSEMGESWPEKAILVTSEHVIMDKTWVNYFTSGTKQIGMGDTFLEYTISVP